MTAAPGSDIQAVCLEIVNEEPGSTGTDVRAELAARGIAMSLPAVSATLAALTRRRLLVRQEMQLAPSAKRRGIPRVVLCYRPPTDPTP